MKYNEWRDELKSNLLCVSESERRRVLDYYAEAYADRRDAGYTEREIIDDFGAPYDAAQRILAESSDYFEPPAPREPSREEKKRERREEKRYEERVRREEKRQEDYYCPPPQPAPAKTREDYTWVFVLLCIVFAIPIFFVVMGMVVVTVCFCVAPFAVLISGVVFIGAGVGALFTDATIGVTTIGTGLVVFGVSFILMPLFFQLVKWMWKLFGMFFAWLKRLFSGKEKK
ncbi:MAG: DUF1700 domain-containing protein [Clostridia bacterium]|nr:DUF1700 domain-containing protein [Clostridia bacterium]